MTMIGAIKTIVTAAAQILAPLVERDPEVYEAKAARRWWKRYVSFSLMAQQEQDPTKKHKLVAKALFARTALAHLPVKPDVLAKLDMAISLAKATD